MIKRFLLLSLLVSSFAMAETSEKEIVNMPTELYSKLNFEDDAPSYMETVVPLAEIIGTKTPNDDEYYEKYMAYINEKTSFEVATLAMRPENAVLYRGDKDYLLTFVLKPKVYVSFKEKKNFVIELEHGRGKVYGVAIKTSSDDYMYKTTREKSLLSDKHSEYIKTYLVEHDWKESNSFLSIFTGKHIFEKENMKITYYGAMGHAVILKIERTDLIEQNAELENIHKEALALTEKKNAQREKEKFEE